MIGCTSLLRRSHLPPRGKAITDRAKQTSAFPLGGKWHEVPIEGATDRDNTVNY